MDPVLIAPDDEIHMEGVEAHVIEFLPNTYYKSNQGDGNQGNSNKEQKDGKVGKDARQPQDEFNCTETVMESGPQTGMESGPQTGMESGPQTSTESEPQTGMELGPQTSTESEPQTGMELGPQTSTESEPQTGMELGPQTSAESEPQTGMESGPEEPAAVIRATPEKDGMTTPQENAITDNLTSSEKRATEETPKPTTLQDVLTAPLVSKPTATVAHIPVVKETLKAGGVLKEGEMIAKMAAEKLTVGEVELLSNAIIQPRRTDGKGKVTQIAVIPPIIDLTNTTEGRGGSSAVEKQLNTAYVGFSQEAGGKKPDVQRQEVPIPVRHSEMVGGVRPPNQPLIRRIWTSSWKPLNPAALERIGSDSNGHVYWYDGGRNMFQSPPTSDPTRVPAESELQLVCKSMVQWMSKLKELRTSNSEADSRLAHLIKEQFISRVRIATQRRPRDPTAIQRLIAASQLKQTLTSSPSPQPATTTFTMTAQQATPQAQMVQPTFPQGSILVVPHPQHPFHSVLPVFANTAVIMPQNAAQHGVGIETHVSTAISDPNKIGGSVIQSTLTNISAKESPDPTNISESFSVTLPASQSAIFTSPAALVAASAAMETTQHRPIIIPGFQPAFPPVFVMKVTDPVPLGTVDFESKSIEISGEVPIRKITSEGDVVIADDNKPSQDIGKGGKEDKRAPQDDAVAGVQGRTSQELLSAKMLLSLKGGELASPLAKDAPQVFSAKQGAGQAMTAKEAVSPLNGSTPHTPSSRKRKQKPTPSVKSSDVTSTPDDKTTPARSRRTRKPKQKGEDLDSSAKETPKRSKKSQQDGKSREFTAEEILAILEIPGSTSQPKSKSQRTGKGRARKATSAAKGKDHDAKLPVQVSKASDKMQQLKAERESKPMKEYVIETDTESSDDSKSSSESGSSSFSPNSGSSSDSSSDSSSEAPVPSDTAKPSPQGRGRSGRGRGRGRGRGGSSRGRGQWTKSTQSSSSDESSSGEEDEKMEVDPLVKRGVGARRGRGRGFRGRARAGHIVRIPTNLLSHKPVTGRKRKTTGSLESDPEKEGDKHDPNRKTGTEFTPDVPVDLATFYASKGGVDLGTLSELTKSVQEKTGVNVSVTQSRSKRTCVRVREEISKLQEILQEDTIPPQSAARPRGRGRGRVQPSGGDSAGRTSDTGIQEVTFPVKKYRRPAYRSQFTHKRRKKKRKPPEEEALWQPARKQPGGEAMKPVYVFSTYMANKAAETVIMGKHDNIVQFHKAQPIGPGFLRLPQPKPLKEQPKGVGGRARKPTETTDSEETSTKPKKRQSSRTSAAEDRTVLKKLRSARKSVDSEGKSPPPVLRSSRRLRSKQRAGSVSSPVSSPDSCESPPPYSPPSSTQKASRSRTQASETPQRVTRSGLRGSSLEAHHKDQEQDDNGHESMSAGKHTPGEDGQSVQEDETVATKPPPTLPTQSPLDSDILSAQQKEEFNYTIVHGTPTTKSPMNDMSSPVTGRATWQRPPSSGDATSTPAAAAAESAFSPCANTGPLVSRSVEQSEQQRPSESLLAQHLLQEQQHRELNWGANLAHPMGVPGAYHSMYGPGLHAMPYPPHGQPIPGANYPYPMPYPWGHATHIPKTQDFHAEMLHHPRSAESHHLAQLGHVPPNTLIQTWSSQQPTPSTLSLSSRPSGDMNAMYSPDPSSAPHSILKPPIMEKLPLTSTQGHHGLPPPPTLHQLPTPGTQPSLSHHHAFARAPEHIPPGAAVHPHAAFSYGFDPSPHSLPQIHMWQQPPPHIRPIAGMHPAHLPTHLPPHGMWYPHMPHHYVPSEHIAVAVDHSKLAKKSSKAKSASTDDHQVNRNANNNNSTTGRVSSQPTTTTVQPWYAEQYHAQAFPQKQTPASFSVEHLTSSQQKRTMQQSVLVRGATWVPPMLPTVGNIRSKIGTAIASATHTSVPDPPSAHKISDSTLEDLPTSAILERTRRSRELAELDITSFPS